MGDSAPTLPVLPTLEENAKQPEDPAPSGLPSLPTETEIQEKAISEPQDTQNLTQNVQNVQNVQNAQGEPEIPKSEGSGSENPNKDESGNPNNSVPQNETQNEAQNVTQNVNQNAEPPVLKETSEGNNPSSVGNKEEEEWEEMEQDENDVMLQGTVQKNNSLLLPQQTFPPQGKEGDSQAEPPSSTPAVSTSSDPSAPPPAPSVSASEDSSAAVSQAPPQSKEEGGDGKQPIVIDLEAMSKVQKEPEAPLAPPEKEEPFVPEEEPAEKTWLAPVVYSLQMLLPDFSQSVGHYIDVLIDADYLTTENSGVKSKALWGNHIYTDDSDVVAVLVHSDKYKLRETKPDHDLRVTLRVLAKKDKYPSATREGLVSREWQDHDGVSFRVTGCTQLKLGEARRASKRGRKQDQTFTSKRRAVLDSPSAPRKFGWQAPSAN